MAHPEADGALDAKVGPGQKAKSGPARVAGTTLSAREIAGTPRHRRGPALTEGRVRRPFPAPLLCAALLTLPARALAADTGAPPPTEPGAYATPLWALLQLVPSSEVVVWDGRARYGARWQVTPLLYSFGINRKLSPWRTFVVEPIVRHSGSIEAYLSPEVLGGAFPGPGDRWIVRGGLRAYFPLLYRGDYLSGSVGGSVFRAKDRAGVGFDGALHTLGGFFGLRVGYSPTPGLRMTTVSLEVRIF